MLPNRATHHILKPKEIHLALRSFTKGKKIEALHFVGVDI